MALTLNGTLGFVGNVVGNLTGNADTATKLTSHVAFIAYQSTAQTAFSTTPTKILFQTKTYDASGSFDTSTSLFTAPIAGYYQLNACLFTPGGVTTVQIFLYKNGSTLIRRGTAISATTTYSSNVSSLVYLAAGDTVEVRGTFSSSVQPAAAEDSTYFTGHLVRPA